MKILFCISCLSYGGAEKNLRTVAGEIGQKIQRRHLCKRERAAEVQTKHRIHINKSHRVEQREHYRAGKHRAAPRGLPFRQRTDEAKRIMKR